MSRTSQNNRPDPAVLDTLRARIRGLERSPAGGDAGAMPLGAPEIDAALPWGGLPRAALHEVLAADTGAAAGFCAALLARLAGAAGTVLWCRRGRGLYGPGLSVFGLEADRAVVVHARRDAEVLWVLEEALRSHALAAVLGEAGDLGQTAARRLQLAAESGGTAALLLRPERGDVRPSPAVTRWRVAAAPSAVVSGKPGVGTACWQVDLLKCRAGALGTAGGHGKLFGAPRSWLVEWRDGKAAGGFAVAAELRDRAVAPASAEDRAIRLAV